MGVKFTNNGESTLALPITDSATTLQVQAGDGNLFPAVSAGPEDYFYATIVDQSGNREIIKCTHRTDGSNVFTVIERAQDDTTARAFLASDQIQLRLPKVILEEYRDDIATNGTNITSNDVDIAALDVRIASLETDQILGAPTGTKLWIYNAEADIPTGWTIDTGPADSLLAVVGGAQAYNVAGQTVAGSWTPTTHVHTGPAHTHSVVSASHSHTGPSHLHTTAGHVLTIAEMPSHSHTLPSSKWQNGSGENGHYQVDTTSGSSAVTTAVKGGGASHAHGNTGSSGTGVTSTDGDASVLTGSSGTANTGSGSAPSTDRPKAAGGLIITRD
jgi:hypothetical protein